MSETQTHELNVDDAITQAQAQVQRALGYLNAFQWLKQQGYRLIPPDWTVTPPEPLESVERMNGHKEPRHATPPA